MRRDKHRCGILYKLGIKRPRVRAGKKIWIHAVSVGEVLLCRPLIDTLHATYPHLSIVVSVTTATGYRMAQKHFANEDIIFYPFDFTWATKGALKVVKPEIVLLAELELWPNFIRAATHQNIPVVVINGRLTEKSFRGFYRALPLLRPMFEGVNLYLMQTELYAQRVHNLGIPQNRVFVTGSMKYDCLTFTCQHDRVKSIIQGYATYQKRPLLVAGSTHNPEETYILNALAPLIKAGKIHLILVPRHPERYKEVESLITSYGLICQRKTGLDTGENYCDTAVIMLDTMGELAQTYGISDVVYIGGTLINHGGQNLMEPAALGKPIICGPSVYNFQETYDLLHTAGATIDVKTPEDLKRECQQNLLQRDLAHIGSKGIQVMKEQAGSTQNHLNHIQRYLHHE